MADDSSIFRRESLERLSSPEQLDQLMRVVKPRSWIPLAALGGLMLTGLLWSILGRIPISTTGQGLLVHPTNGATDLVALGYFPSGDGERIQPGMSIVLVPSTIRTQGGIVGRVRSVTQSPITTLDAARQTELPAINRPIEVVVDLERDATTVSGYRWSASQGPNLQLAAGLPITFRITLERKAPIAFVFPFLEAGG